MAVFICVLLVILAHVCSCDTIGQIKALPDGSQVSITGCVTLLEADQCYIESIDRASGIWVQGNAAGLSLGDVVNVAGTLGSTSGERNIQSATMTRTGDHATILPFSLRNGGLGGFASVGNASLQDYVLSGGVYQWQITGGGPNTGLLTKIWGTVNAVYYSPVSLAHWFYVDDGSGVVSDFGDQGVIVYSDADVHEGDCVTVTGVSSTETALDGPARLVRTIRPRTAADVVVVKPYKFMPVYPFSDEFNSPTLDPKWMVDDDISRFSLTDNPGWLTLNFYDEGAPGIYQQTGGDWDLEMKLRPRFDTRSTSPTQYCGMWLTSFAWMDFYTYWPVARLGYDPKLEGVTAYLSNTKVTVGFSNDYWLRVRMRSGVAYSSVSLDGTTYSAEQSGTPPPGYWFIVIRVTTNGYVFAYSPMIDYVRFTRL